MSEKNKLVAIIELCASYQIPQSFLFELSEYDLVQIVIVERENYIGEREIQQLEQMIRLHRDLGITADAMPAVFTLLEQVDEQQAEIRLLRDRLALYE